MSVRIKWLESPLVSVPERARREAERALAEVDLSGLGDYERDGSSATLTWARVSSSSWLEWRASCSFSHRFGSAVASWKSTLSARWRG
jgi:hypothetical protein